MAFSKVVYFEETVCLGVKVSVQRVMEGTSAVLYWPGLFHTHTFKGRGH